MIINVPDNGPSHIYGRKGETYVSKILDGRLVVDMPPEMFRTLLLSRQGLLWEKANEGGDVWRFLAQGAHS